MSKIKLLLSVAADMRSLADSIQALCDSLAENEPTAPPVAEKEISLETVRAVLAEKSQQGKTAEVRDIIAKCGGTKLSEIPKEQYADLLKLAEVL